MQRKYYKSLDRPLNIFGLRGNWIRFFGYGAGVSLVLGVIVGVIIGAGGGMGVFIGGLVASFFVCLVLQAKTPSKRLDKVSLQSKMNVHVVRRETLARIIWAIRKIRLKNDTSVQI